MIRWVTNWSLKKKFSLLMVLIFLPLFFMISSFLYRQEYLRRVEDEVTKMRLVALSLSQNWSRLWEKERNENPEESKGQMSYFYQTFEHCSEMREKILSENPFLIIRYASLIPRNPDNKADFFEQEGIRFLEQEKNQGEYIRISKFQGEKAIRYLRPLRKEPFCLQCHAGREKIPMAFSLKNLKKIAFQQEEIQGVISITIPARSFTVPLWQKWERSFLMHVSLFGCIIFIWLVFSKVSIFDRLGILADGMTSIIKGDRAGQEVNDIHQDEISPLFSLFHVMNEDINQKIFSLQEEKDIYQSITQSSIYGVLVFDVQGKVLFLNEGAVKIFGWEKEEIEKQNVMLLISPQFRHRYKRFIERYLSKDCFENKEIGIFKHPIETTGLRKSGEEFTMCLSLSMGKCVGNRIFTVIVQDITEQKRKEGEIIRQNEKLVLLNQVSTELIRQRDLKKLAEDSLYESLDLTDSFCGLFLLQNKDGDLIPLSTLGLMEPENETSQAFKPVGVLGEILRQKQPRIINTSARRMNRTILSCGKFSFYSFLGVPIIADQEVIGVMCVANRIKGYTDKEQKILTSLVNDVSLLIVRNAVEKETQILEEKFRTLFDQSSDMIVICTREGEILTLNHRVIQYTGYSYQELIEHPLWRLYLPAEERKCKEFIKHVWAKGFSRQESFFRQKDGGGFPVDMQANTVIFANQKIIQVVARDTVHAKQLEDSLKNRLESLKKQLEDRGKEVLFYKNALNNIPEYIIFTDRRGRIFFANKAFCQRFNYLPQELVGQPYEVLFHSSVSVNIIDEIMSRAHKGEWKGGAVYTTKESHMVQVELAIRAIHVSQGGISGLLGIAIESNDQNRIIES